MKLRAAVNDGRSVLTCKRLSLTLTMTSVRSVGNLSNCRFSRMASFIYTLKGESTFMGGRAIKQTNEKRQVCSIGLQTSNAPRREREIFRRLTLFSISSYSMSLRNCFVKPRLDHSQALFYVCYLYQRTLQHNYRNIASI